MTFFELIQKYKFNSKRKEYDDMYNRDLLETPEKIIFETKDDFILMTSLCNCYICYHFKCIYPDSHYMCDIEHKKCNSLDITGDMSWYDTQFRNEVESDCLKKSKEIHIA